MHFSHKLIFLVLLIPLCAGGTENQTDKKYLDSALRREGNPENGKKIFKDKRALCSECHSIDGQSDSIGPDLSAAGDKFSRADLILSVMNPSANIMAGYGTTVIETKDQSTFMGKRFSRPSTNFNNIEGFDTRSIDVSLGRIFGGKDIEILETLFWPFMNSYDYTKMSEKQFIRNLKKIIKSNHKVWGTIKRY